jgi:hypothetical protein
VQNISGVLRSNVEKASAYRHITERVRGHHGDLIYNDFNIPAALINLMAIFFAFPYTAHKQAAQMLASRSPGQHPTVRPNSCVPLPLFNQTSKELNIKRRQIFPELHKIFISIFLD